MEKDQGTRNRRFLLFSSAVATALLLGALLAGMTFIAQAAPADSHALPASGDDASAAAIWTVDEPVTTTVTFQQGTVGYTGVQDAFIASTAPNGNFGADTRISLYSDGRYKGLIRFDLSSIPSQVMVLDARLTMEIYYLSGTPTAMTISAYPISRPWQVDQVTWNRASDAEAWGAPGCGDVNVDRSAVPAGTLSKTTKGSYQMNVTSTVANWVADSESNHGLLLVSQGSPAIQVDHAASEYSMISVRPKLTITYSVTGPLPTFTPTRTPTPTPTGTPEPSVYITSTALSTNPCMAVGPDYDSNPAYPDHGVVFAFWQGTPTFARLWLKQANVDGEHSLYVNGHFVGRTVRDSRGSICAPGTGYYYSWDFDPAYMVSGYNVISFTHDAVYWDNWGVNGGYIVVGGDLSVPETRTFTYTSSYDGSQRQATLQIPIGHDPMTPVPLLTSLYGLGETMVDGWRRYAQPANYQGWLLVVPDMRQNTISPAVRQDIIDAVNWVKDNYAVDPLRVYLAGLSMGGNKALVMAAQYPSTFAAVVAHRPITNLSDWYYETTSFRKGWLEAELGGKPNEVPFEYQRRSPYSQVQNFRHIPVALTHGTEDTIVSVTHSINMYDALLANGAQNAYFYSYPGGHGDDGPYDSAWTLNFLSQWMLDENPTDIGIRADSSRSYYWLDIRQIYNVDHWTAIDAGFGPDTGIITATIDDYKQLQVGFDLGWMGLPAVEYTVEDYAPASGEYLVYTIFPVGDKLWISTGGSIHQLTLTPGTASAPTEVTFQQGLSGYAGATDSYIHLWNPDTNFSTQSQLWVRSDMQPYPYASGVIRFDVTDIPPEALIKAATLKLSVVQSGTTGNRLMNISSYGIRRPWAVDEVTWNDARDDDPWAAAGCNDTEIDRDSLPSDTDSITNTTQTPVLTITNLVQQWVANPEVNYGLMLRGSGTQSGVYAFASGEYVNVASRPRLRVIYTIPTATPTPTETPTPTATFTPASTSTPSRTPTVTGSATAPSTATGVATATPTATPTGPTATPSSTHTPGGDTATPTPTVTMTSDVNATDTPTPTVTATYNPGSYGTLAGIVWYDGNGNGIREPVEETLIGVQITLANETGEPIQTRVSMQGGMYVFVDLPPGDYYVREMNLVGYISTTPDEVPVTVTPGKTIVVDFGDRLPARLTLPLVVKASAVAGGGGS